MRTVDALKPLTAGKLLELWRYYRERVEDPLERTLLCNAAILRDSSIVREKRFTEMSWRSCGT